MSNLARRNVDLGYEVKDVVTLREALLDQLNLCLNGKLSTEALKGINGSVGQFTKSIVAEYALSKGLDIPMNKSTLKLMFTEGQIK